MFKVLKRDYIDQDYIRKYVFSDISSIYFREIDRLIKVSYGKEYVLSQDTVEKVHVIPSCLRKKLIKDGVGFEDLMIFLKPIDFLRFTVLQIHYFQDIGQGWVSLRLFDNLDETMKSIGIADWKKELREFGDFHVQTYRFFAQRRFQTCDLSQNVIRMKYLYLKYGFSYMKNAVRYRGSEGNLKVLFGKYGL